MCNKELPGLDAREQAIGTRASLQLEAIINRFPDATSHGLTLLAVKTERDRSIIGELVSVHKDRKRDGEYETGVVSKPGIFTPPNA